MIEAAGLFPAYASQVETQASRVLFQRHLFLIL